MKMAILAVAIVSSGACNVFEADFETDLGAIYFFSNPEQLVFPDTVNVGQSFVVNVRTFGDGCVSFGRTEVEVDDRTAEIRPYDRRETGVPCPELLRIIDHPATLRFNTPGSVTIRITGMRVPQNQVDTIQRQVVVR